MVRKADLVSRLQQWETVLKEYWDVTKPSPTAPEQVLHHIKSLEKKGKVTSPTMPTGPDHECG